MEAITFMGDCDASAECHSALRHFCGWLVNESGSNERLADDSQSAFNGKSKVTVLWNALHGIREPKPGTKSGQ